MVGTRDRAQPNHHDPAYVATLVSNATTLSATNRDRPIVLGHAAKASHEPKIPRLIPPREHLAALPQILDWYASHGYRFVNLAGQS